MKQFFAYGTMRLSNDYVGIYLAFYLHAEQDEATMTAIAINLCKANGLDYMYWEEA